MMKTRVTESGTVPPFGGFFSHGGDAGLSSVRFRRALDLHTMMHAWKPYSDLYTINRGKMWHVKDRVTGKTLGFRNYYNEALGLIKELQSEKVNA